MRGPRAGHHPVDRTVLAVAPLDGPPTVLVLRALGLGDLLTGVPALRALADALPEHRLVLATTAGMAAFARYARLADEVLVAAPLAALDWPGPRPDVAVNLHGCGAESHRVLAATSPRRLVAFASGDHPGPEWRADEHEVHRWCRLLDESGIPADPRRLSIDAPPAWAAPAAAVAAGLGATVVHPGAGSPARRWPAERWAAVARAETHAGPRVVVTGTRSEAAVADEVAARAGLPSSAVVAGTTDVVGLAAVLARAGRVVSGDTGVAHLATALGTPSVVLFGPVPPDQWGPPPERPQHLALWAGLTGDPHGQDVDPGLLAISVVDVLAALDGLEHLDRATVKLIWMMHTYVSEADLLLAGARLSGDRPRWESLRLSRGSGAHRFRWSAAGGRGPLT